MYRLENFKEQIKKQRGFLLVDSIVAVVVLAIGLVAIARLYMYGTDYRYRAANRQKAVQIAAERIERLKVDEANKKDLDNIKATMIKSNSDSVVKLSQTDTEEFTVNLTINNEEPSEGTTDASLKDSTNIAGDDKLYLITATVKWPKDKLDHSIQLSTYVKASD